ncbi:MAG: hypothetical protein IT427_20205 [Pirellulales bacterium]|nr:hypothetical protein [Pirellulales bacterium]
MRPPSNVRPTSRPSLPSGGLASNARPSIGNQPGIARPSPGANRPSLGAANRPGIGENRPGGADRPSIGGGNRPGGGGRPEIGNGNRPGGGLRPGGGGNRPDRPIIGGGGNRPNRPGGPGINNGNINIGNSVIGGGNVVGNRPGWDHGNWNNPGWGWGNNGWAGNWHNNCINDHHGWYNGCWNGHWGSSWYAPLAWGAAGWGLGAWTSGWGYGSNYYNPYYAEPVAAATVPYDYSQPVVVSNYAPADTGEGTTAPLADAPPHESDEALKLFDDGLAQFKSGDYRAALGKLDEALQKLPGDPVVHEVRALTLFALGEYTPAAAALNSFLSSAPGMDWTTMSSLYGDPKDYESQLRKLEQFCRDHRNDAAAYFVLAYQYLVLDSKDSAVNALKVVVKNQPKDSTAKRMLDALSTPTAPPAPESALAAENAPQTDLVGKWQAKASGTTIDLTITDDSKFTWKAIQPGKSPIEMKGDLASTSDQLALQTADQGSMGGIVKSLGSDKWQFNLSGAPPSDPGLTFVRAKS